MQPTLKGKYFFSCVRVHLCDFHLYKLLILALTQNTFLALSKSVSPKLHFLRPQINSCWQTSTLFWLTLPKRLTQQAGICLSIKEGCLVEDRFYQVVSSLLYFFFLIVFFKYYVDFASLNNLYLNNKYFDTSTLIMFNYQSPHWRGCGLLMFYLQ